MAVNIPNSTPGQHRHRDSLNILLVDDEANIREALAEYLASLNNHRLVTAASGPEALARFTSRASSTAPFWT